MKFDPVPKVVRPRDAPCIVALPALLACKENVCGEPGMSRFRATLHAARPLTGAMKEPRSPLTAMYRVRRPTNPPARDRKSTRLNSSHGYISYAVFCLKKKKQQKNKNTKHHHRQR